jgi:hypothetical protein
MKVFLIKYETESESVKNPNALSLSEKYFAKSGKIYFKTKIEKITYSQKVKAVSEKDIQKCYGDKLRSIKFLEELPESPFSKLEQLYDDGHVQSIGKRREVKTEFLRNSEQMCSDEVQEEYKRLGDMWFNRPINQ